MTDHNVFISWALNRSKEVALALHGWLPKVLQAANPWMSDVNVPKGSQGLAEIADVLEGINIGIVCLTPENIHNDWILFESGALTKHLTEKPRLCTYLFGGLKNHDLRPPLGMFQSSLPEPDDTRKLLASVNAALGSPVKEQNLDDIFIAMWPDLKNKLDAIKPAAEPAPESRSDTDMLAELLEIARSEAGRCSEFNHRSIFDRWMLKTPVRGKLRLRRAADHSAFLEFIPEGSDPPMTGFIPDMRASGLYGFMRLNLLSKQDANELLAGKDLVIDVSWPFIEKMFSRSGAALFRTPE